jgi:hypothetical protein
VIEEHLKQTQKQQLRIDPKNIHWTPLVTKTKHH